MKKLLVLVVLFLTVCSTAFAESLEDVLKDCKLDRSRWIVMEWFKAEKFVRFYDSESLSVAAPGQFGLVTYDYYYDNTCKEESCNYRNMKHYHSEKSVYDSYMSTKKLLSFGKLDADLNVLSSYDYPPSMQIADPINKKSIDNKTLLKGKELLKNDKAFAVEAPKRETAKPQDNYGKFAPLPQPIGSSDGEWVYLGRFTGQNNMSYIENILSMQPFNGTTARDGVLDVYYHHTHDMCHYHEYGYSYKCILKLIPLDMNGNRISRRGFYTELVDIAGGTKGAFSCAVTMVRKFDTATHELVETMTDKRVDYIYWSNAKLNRRTDSGKLMDALLYEYPKDNPFSTAMNTSNCPKPDYWK